VARIGRTGGTFYDPRVGRRTDTERAAWPGDTFSFPSTTVSNPKAYALGRPAGTLRFLYCLNALRVLDFGSPKSKQEKVLAVPPDDIALLHIPRSGDADGSTGGMPEVADLIKALLSASSHDDALTRFVRFCWERFDRPVAGWSLADGKVLALVGTRGIGSEGEHELFDRSQADRLPLRKGDVIARFQKVMGSDRVGILDANDGLVLVGTASGRVQDELDALAPIIALLLSHIADVAGSQRRIEDLDAGIAATAHELRGPLLGAEKAIDRVLGSDHSSPADLKLLELAHKDLRRLAATVDGLLRSSVGIARLRRRRTNLARLVNDVIESCAADVPRTEGVDVDLPDAQLTATIDAPLVRAAVENVVRNALTHGDRKKVQVSLVRHDGVATITVRDEGPGIDPRDREAVFEPFVRRGRAGSAPDGVGLGLFIARRVVQAHGGRIRVDGEGRGASFHLDLPVDAA
jgi:signal transduction histidine kinase